jgi:hypothetical protein
VAKSEMQTRPGASDAVVCQNSAERDPKRNRRLVPQPKPPRSAELSPFALDRGRMDWLHRRSSEVGGACKDFPARRDELPAPAHRELAATAVERRGNFGPVSSRRVRYRRNSLYFPCRSGIWPQRRVRPRLPPPPFSLRLRRLRGRNRNRPQSPAVSRGFGGAPRRTRTGDCRFRSWKAPQSVFVSVAKLAGSESL